MMRLLKGLWSRMRFRKPQSSALTVAETPQEPVSETIEAMTKIRAMAALMVGGQVSSRLAEEIYPPTMRWLRILTKRELCIVAVARDNRLRRHLLGIETITGLRIADPQAVDEYEVWMKAKRRLVDSERQGRQSGGGPKRVDIEDLAEALGERMSFGRRMTP